MEFPLSLSSGIYQSANIFGSSDDQSQKVRWEEKNDRADNEDKSANYDEGLTSSLSVWRATDGAWYVSRRRHRDEYQYLLEEEFHEEAPSLD